MTANSRNKGSAFEREVAAILHAELGMTFKRDLEQYRANERGDLICDNPDWPFLLELKRYASGNGCRQEWWAQAYRAAIAQNLRPVVIYKFDRLPIRACMNLKDVMECIGRGQWSAENHQIDMPLSAFFYIAREGMCQ